MKRVRNPQDWEKELQHFPVHPKGVPSSLKRKVEERIKMENRPNNRRVRVWFGSLLAAAVLALLLVQQESLLRWLKPDLTKTTKAETFDQTTERTLKLLAQHRDTFMRSYGNAFIIKYPNMSINTLETISMNLYQQNDLKTVYYELMNKEQPDVVFVPLQVYKEMAADGLLYPLDTFIREQKYDLNAYRPGVIEFLREAGGGMLYGLYPTFSSQAIYYNKDLFDRYGIPHPTDRMSWDELLRLAARFPIDGTGDKRVFGFVPASSDAYNIARMIAQTQRLNMTDPEGKKLLANTPSYRSIWTTVANGVKKGWISQNIKSLVGLSSNNIEWYQRNDFFTGNSAMILSNESLARDLMEAKRRFNVAAFAWDIITEPVNPQSLDEATTHMVQGIYAINAKAANPKDAWELIKFIHSEPLAKKNTASSYVTSVPSTFRNIQMKPETARMEAFTSLKPSLEASLTNANLPQSFSSAMAGIVNTEIKLYAQSAQSLDQMIEAIQSEGQAALDKSNASPK